MIQLIVMIASVGIGAIATFAWIEKEHGLSLLLFGLSLYLGLQSIRTVCGW
jgi:hypothetical protein